MTYVVLVALAVFSIIPFVVMFFGSFRDHTDVIKRGALALPLDWSFRNFSLALNNYGFGKYYTNTILVTLPTVLLALLFASMAGFALAFMDFKFKQILRFATTVLGISVAAEFIMIPLFRLLHGLNLINTYPGAIIPQLAMSACFATMVIQSFFQGLPNELVDAALVDGASSWQTLWRVMIPIAKPALLTAGSLITIWTWNSYIIPLIFLTSPQKTTLPVGLVLFQDQYTMNIPLVMAGTTLTALPMLVLYLVFQGHIATGLSQGAVK